MGRGKLNKTGLKIPKIEGVEMKEKEYADSANYLEVFMLCE